MSRLFNLDDIIESFKAVAGTISFRRDNGPIDSIFRLEQFVATRAAFVAQKTLYGYLKTRIGTRYPRMFEDEIFVQSINIAKFHVFAACLSDLGIYAAAHALDGKPVTDATRRDLALRCFRRGLYDNSTDVPASFSADEAEHGFINRLELADWAGSALHRDNFSLSPVALLRWSPISPELKKNDVEIVKNSIKFAWRDIREQYRKRLDDVAVFRDLESAKVSVSANETQS